MLVKQTVHQGRMSSIASYSSAWSTKDVYVSAATFFFSNAHRKGAASDSTNTDYNSQNVRASHN